MHSLNLLQSHALTTTLSHSFLYTAITILDGPNYSECPGSKQFSLAIIGRYQWTQARPMQRYIIREYWFSLLHSKRDSVGTEKRRIRTSPCLAKRPKESICTAQPFTLYSFHTQNIQQSDSLCCVCICCQSGSLLDNINERDSVNCSRNQMHIIRTFTYYTHMQSCFKYEYDGKVCSILDRQIPIFKSL